MPARHRTRRLLFATAVALLAGAAAGAAPDSLATSPVMPDTGAALRAPDSTLVLPLTGWQGASPAPAEVKSPGTAALLSALLPGAGQAYNESYWKVPVVAGFGAFFVSRWLHFNRLADEARDRYAESLLTSSGDQQQLRLREFYKDERDTYSWYLFILYLLNVADAYVDASLYDFTVSDDLSLRVLPEGPGRIALRITF
jgi:hypothetical protein